MGKISEFLGYSAAVVNGINVYTNTNDFFLALRALLYDVLTIKVSGYIGSLLGSLIGGPLGAIFGTYAAIKLEQEFQKVKADVWNCVIEVINYITDVFHDK